jgi:alpha-1,2-mannosyltransferase
VLVSALAAWLAIIVVTNSPLDFYVYYMAGALLHRGQSPYVISETAWRGLASELHVSHFSWPYRYPPFTAALGRALSPLGPHGAMIVWETANAIGFVAGAWLVGLALGGGWRLVLALGTTLFCGPVYHTLLDGQVNGLAFVFLALAFWGVMRRRAAAGGIGVAAAAALKLTPIALMAYFFWRRSWRTALASLAALAAMVVLFVPLVSLHGFGDYMAHAFLLTDPQRINLSPQNQSLTAVVGRLLLPQTTWASTERTTVVHIVAIVFAAVLAVATAAVLWPRRRAARAGPAAAEVEGLGFGMVIAATLVVGPFTYYHQFAWLLIPLLLIADRLIRARRWLPLALLGVLLLAVDANELLWKMTQVAMLDSGVWRLLSLPFLFAMVIWATCAVMVWRSQTAVAETTR